MKPATSRSVQTEPPPTHSLSFPELLSWLASAPKQGIQAGRALWRLGPRYKSVKETQSVNYK